MPVMMTDITSIEGLTWLDAPSRVVRGFPRIAHLSDLEPIAPRGSSRWVL